MLQTEEFHQNHKEHEKKTGQAPTADKSEKGRVLYEEEALLPFPASAVCLDKRDIISMKDGAKRDEQRAREEHEAIDPESAREPPTTPPYSIFTRSQKRYIASWLDLPAFSLRCLQTYTFPL